MKKWIALLLCLSMMMTGASLAEDATVAATTEAASAAELQAADVLANVNGTDVAWGDVERTYNVLVNQYGSYYDMTDASNIELFRAVALENKITETLLAQKAVELGLSLSAEETAAAETEAQTNWDSAIASYVSQNYPDLNDESSQEDKDAANAAAAQYYNDLGYSPEGLKTDFTEAALYNKVTALMTQDAVVTDEEVEAMYQSLVAADKEKYQNDISAYIEYNDYVDQMAMYAMYMGSDSNMDYAWYKPVGFRAVKHILLSVDQTLLDNYKDLQARLEEQINDEAAEATADPSVTPDPAATATPEPVTQADVDNAEAEILASLQDKIEEINQKIAEGVDFDELIATYAVDADGNATDPGMTSDPYKTTGYEVAEGSTNYVAPFVKAAFSVSAIGDVSAPYVSDYGVHIVKYIGDVPEGPVAMTDAQREAKRAELLQSKQNELYTATMDSWLGQSTIQYTGLIPSMADIEAREAAAAEEAALAEEEAAPEATAAEPTATPAN